MRVWPLVELRTVVSTVVAGDSRFQGAFAFQRGARASARLGVLKHHQGLEEEVHLLQTRNLSFARPREKYRLG